MSNILEYKGYITRIEYSIEDKVLFGKIEGIDDLVTFESESIDNIENEFHQAVDDYLLYCKEIGKEPNKSYKGTFNVRIDPKLHKDLSFYAIRHNLSLNSVVEKSIASYINNLYNLNNNDNINSFYSLSKIILEQVESISKHDWTIPIIIKEVWKETITKNHVVQYVDKNEKIYLEENR